MKKIIPLATLTLTAMMTVGLLAVEKQSSLSENPLLTANVEALSAAETVDGDVVDLGRGTILLKNQKNHLNQKGKPDNYCVSGGGGCVISAGYKANNTPDWTTFVRDLFKENAVSKFVSAFTKLISLFK